MIYVAIIKGEKTNAVTLAAVCGIESASCILDIQQRYIKLWIEKKIPCKTTIDLIIENNNFLYDKKDLEALIKELELTIMKSNENAVKQDARIKELESIIEKATQTLNETALIS